ncbi:hypothetical protein COF84_25740 [Bacillus wiedmannii]|uniref:AAA family ATPase n=1 Tax=Bacillus wiedmannii TaxID=1890302 RepID=UPI000BFB2913|nr:hypothetical protein [Bacillus wiedmannii]PHF12382.1 hypothetical protein COF84_25740 [Bacillus wiedmannii]
MKAVYLEVENWLSQRPRWLQDAAVRLINNNELSRSDISELVELCKIEAGLLKIDRCFAKVTPGSISSREEKTLLKLDAIHSVRGVSALGAKKPLEFKGSLSIIYGQNGSGKSSYVRLLKHISGTKKQDKLIGNVFVSEEQVQKCTLNLTNNGEKKEIEWNPTLKDFNEINSAQIYDTECANVYINEENEVAYEPWLLMFLSKLTQVCTEVGEALKNEKSTINLVNPQIPNEFLNSELNVWFNSLSHKTTVTEINDKCSWNDEDELELTNKKKLISESDLSIKVKQFRTGAQNLIKLKTKLADIRDSINDEICIDIIDARLDYERKKNTAEEVAKKIFEGLPLDGVGTDSWKLLWEQARRYSEEYAYPADSFPYTSSEANCVLCQQPLSSEAKTKFNSFEAYVKQGLNNEAEMAEQLYHKLLNSVKQISKEEIDLHMASVESIEGMEVEKVFEFCSSIYNRIMRLHEVNKLGHLPPLPDDGIIIAMDEIASSCEQEAITYEEGIDISKRESIKRDIIEMEYQKWLFQQKNVFEENVLKLKMLKSYDKAISLTKTQALSTKKSTLSDTLITDEYKMRFQKELASLGCSRINVELVKSKARKGQIYHKIKLKGCPDTIKAADVLSEGELRIVSLAGFISDVEGSPSIAPFIFDDPISSLDQSFEEATVNRVIKLSQSRQVIVFTHRLSLLTMLEEMAGKLGIDYDVTCLRRESWGAGEPGEIPVFAKKPEKVLNTFLNERLPRAKRALLNDGRDEYDLLAKAICSDFRILLERFIENDLLGDIVHRFRRDIQTKGKISKLALICKEDCDMFEGYMTKYSTFEHSQSYETPVNLPEPEEIKKDMEDLREWLKEFKSRTPKI